ncbi:choline dehydrogenase [Natronoglycomyces albus]|uniref:Choline dehydrogenase n=1 Tax=Natronoglycomyces albus TaxID=2811108 RepID=A0A895XHX0_9ACTN|nr:choline dehydrogenase [Natronoglycomyces albus]QSB05421.1 choline dehydrogenase [Natronoglycomyces albus]
MAIEKYDYIIVGGGSAGCVLANRLSADPSNKVLVLEAGRSDWWFDVLIHMPAALTMVIGNPLYDWRYESEPEEYMGGRRVYHGRGKVLGGSSSINGMIFQRGNPMDLQRWASDPGMETWDYAHCLPYFKRMETRVVDGHAAGNPWRGDRGPLHLERGDSPNPLFGAFLEAAQQAGYPITSDVNGYQQEGFSRFDRNIKNGRRWSAARAYYHPVKQRPNLTLKTLAHVNRVVFKDNEARGVIYQRPGGRPQAVRGGEVILCGGAINTPQILQLSGVGPADHLRSVGVDVVQDMPGVGDNLQDHLEVYVQHACKQPVTLNPTMKLWKYPFIGAQWMFTKTGPASTNHFEAGGFARSNDEVEYPNLMFHFLPIAVRYDGTKVDAEHGYQVHIGPMYSDVRGDLKIASANPRQKPKMRFNYLSTKNDRREWVEAIAVARDILRQEALEPYDAGEISPGPFVQSDEDILDWVAKDAETAYHPSCTAKMGTDDMSVVDPTTMKVHGLENLRVVDASAMPYLTNGNIYAPVMMLAEKAADLILGNTPLPPAEVDWYRAKK